MARIGIRWRWTLGAPGVLLALAVWSCAAHKPVEYVIPADVTGENRELMIERCETGRMLFKVNCSECHGIYGGGKDSIPNFSAQQIDNYNANYIKADPRNHAVARQLSQQQVDCILTFLRLRKR